MKCLDRNINNPLRRDGTSQAQRQAASLVESYVKIDERSDTDLISYARQLANLFQYFDNQNNPTTDWTAFFHENNTGDQPHYTLFLAFLRLMSHARDHINSLRKAYLEYYYKEVLQMENKKALPDQAIVIFELAKNVNEHLIKKGIYLNAGKDETGVERWYKTDNALVVNKAVVSKVKSLYHTYEEQTDIQGEINVVGEYFYKDEDTSSQDYSGFDKTIAQTETVKIFKSNCQPGVIEEPEIVCDGDKGLSADLTEVVPPYWKPFGVDQLKEADATRMMEDVKLGFAFSSPLLLMEIGRRVISWHIKFREIPPGFDTLDTAALSNAFDISINGEKDWIALTEYDCRPSAGFLYLHFTIVIPSDVEAIKGLDAEVYGDEYKTEWPVLRVQLKNNSNPQLYKLLSKCKVSLNNIQVNVTGIKELVIQNDASALDSSKPFLPFGAQPQNGASFLAGYPEAFQKPLKTMTFDIEWDGVPTTKLKDQYAAYPWKISNATFRVNVRVLHKNNFNHIALSNIRLFNNNAESVKTINIQSSQLPTDFERTLDKQPFNRFDQTLETGFARFDLNVNPYKSSSSKISNLGLDFGGFGHKAYPKLLTDAVIKRANKTDADATLPKEPYTPTIKSLNMGYAAQLYFFARNAEKEGVERFYHIHPFGVAEQFVEDPSVDTFPLIPPYPGNGYLYLGIEQLTPGSIITLYFQIAEGTGNPLLDFEKSELSFSVLINNEWVPLSSSQLLSDSTGSLQYSGIVTLNIPKEATNNNTLLPGALHWIQLSFAYKEGAPKRAGDFPGILAINTQALLSTFEDRNNDLNHYNQVLASESIKKLVAKDAAVKKVTQPFSSIKGKPEESSDHFFVRSSERLRHKNRSINIWDYERMVLEEFPGIYKVKCLNHSNALTDVAPGEVFLVVIRNIRNGNIANPLQPLVSVRTIDQVEQFLKAYNSPFIKLKVDNPIYEQVKVTFDVGFYPGFDEGFYKQQLNREIIQYLSPWAYEEGEDIVFGGKIYASSILAFIEKRPYVDYVTNFRMFHIYDSEGIACMTVCRDFIVGGGFVETEVDVAIAKTARSALTSAPTHCINTLVAGQYVCD